MRYQILGDVHANLTALETVLEAGKRHNAEAYLFTGDLVGYGPEPLECIARMQELAQRGQLAWVAGNHDRVARGEIEPLGYINEAAETLAWTRQLLAAEPWALEFLMTVPLAVKVNEGIQLTHDSLVAPGSAGYHQWPKRAEVELACVRHNEGRVCFYGHTHKMRAEVVRGEVGVVLVPMFGYEGEGDDPAPLRLGAQDIAWANAGSVGFPTNPSRLAEFLILDDKDWVIERYAVAYPREAARERLETKLSPVCSAEVVTQIARWL
ncbi:MAG: metallophosphoesterase family protein [Verrucomicrobiia bacterium]